MVDVNQLKNQIIDILKIKGPSLPMQISNEIKQSSIFTSAFLSELNDEKRIKTSSLKVGGSHLYYLEGQESQLEKFYKYLHPKEAEAFLLLKEKKVLKESEQEPAIRVALREIKDFSKNLMHENEVYWRHILIPESEIILLLKPKIEEGKIITKTPIIKEEIITKEKESKNILEIPKEKPLIKIKKPVSSDLKKSELAIRETIFNNPLAPKQVEKPKKEKPKSEFVLNVIDFIENSGFKIKQEKEHKVKEYLALVEVESNLGPITFLTQAKEKKSISDSDLQKLLSESQSIPLPALMLYTENLTKKASEYAEKYSSILKIKKIS